MTKTIYWRIYFVLITFCIIGVSAVFPYILTVQKDLISQIPVTIPLFFLIQLIQSIIIFSIAILIGLKLVNKSGFSVPYLEAFVSRNKLPADFRPIIKSSAILGASVAVIIAILDYFFGMAGLDRIVTETAKIPMWQRFLVAFYGGVNEEVLMRFFLMTALTWIIYKVAKIKSESKYVIWSVIILTSVIFGLGHLPITASFTEITPLVVTRAILLNSVGGIIFGWLYWKKGLEAAIIAHFSADIFLHLLIPLIIFIR
jgi:membrane protease YdiL (CAAX protease family)